MHTHMQNQRGNCGNQFSSWVVMRLRSPGSVASTPTPETYLLSFQQLLFEDKERIKLFCSPLCRLLSSDRHGTVPLYQRSPSLLLCSGQDSSLGNLETSCSSLRSLSSLFWCLPGFLITTLPPLHSCYAISMLTLTPGL